MINLNIISPSLKKEIKTKSLYRDINKLAAMILAATILYSAVFLGVKFAMQAHFNELSNGEGAISRGPENHLVTVKEINDKIEAIAKIQDEAIYWSYLIEDIRGLTGPDIAISKIQADADKLTFYLKGLAASRDSLLIFKENLEASGLFEDVELPIQSLLSKTNISFDMNLKLNSYEFK